MKETLEILENAKNDLIGMHQTAVELNLIIEKYIAFQYEPGLRNDMLKIHDEIESHIDDLDVVIKYLTRLIDEIKNNPELSIYDMTDYVTLTKIILIGLNNSRIDLNNIFNLIREKLNETKEDK